MNLKYRKFIAKIKPIHKLCKMIMYNSGVIFYKKKYKNDNYNNIFAKMKDSKYGKRCFIIGNGPSLSVHDLELLVNEDCIGTNEIHKIFPQTRWRPKYYLIMDRYSKSTPEQIENLECETVFLGDYYWRFNTVLRKDAICLHQHFCYDTNKIPFSSDISKMIINSPTVSFGAMQIAVYLGYTQVYLLGFDHNYTFEFASDGSIIKTNQKATHFFEDEIPESIIANVWGMAKAYEAFKKYADKQGIKVKNATRGGKLEVFERVEFDELFN
jgi:hypothetical protein